MSSHFQKSASFLMGCLFSATAVVLLGAAISQPGSQRYDADFDTIMGGLGGLTIEITDHSEQKAYLYVFNKEKGQDTDEPVPRLAATIDLTSAGKPILNATLVETTDAKKED